MRLILASADFSGDKGIGTMNSWFITYSRPSGLTWTQSPSSVTKGGPLTAKATLNTASYELTTISVEMGGKTQTGEGTSNGITISKSGSEYTISITAVSANVNVTVVTQAIAVTPSNYTLTINPTPTDATVTLTASGYSQSGNSITVANGTSVSWSVSKSGYVEQNGTWIANGANETKSVTLTAEGSTDPTPGGTTTYYFKDQATKGYLFGNVVKDSSTSRTTDYIDISGVSQIGYWGRMGYVEGSTYHALEFYDSNKNYLSSLSVLGTGSPMVKNINLTDSKYANAKYVRASVAQSTYTTDQFNTWYFIVGGSASEDNGGNGGSSGNVTDYFPINEYIAASTHTSASFGEMVSGNGGPAYRTDYIAISGKTTVNYTGRMGTIGCNYAFYDSSKKVIPGLELVGDGTTVTKTINLSDSKYANATYIVASISRGSISDADWAKSYFAIS